MSGYQFNQYKTALLRYFDVGSHQIQTDLGPAEQTSNVRFNT